MTLHLMPDSRVPIFEQIERYWIYRIAAGDPAPGERIPSVRDMAQRLLVHPNTIVHAYGELERSGIIVPRRGIGMEITAEGPEVCRAKREALLRERVKELFAEAEQAGMTRAELVRLVREIMNQMGD
jgi:GntR family transcriptional regulator